MNKLNNKQIAFFGLTLAIMLNVLIQGIMGSNIAAAILTVGAVMAFIEGYK